MKLNVDTYQLTEKGNLGKFALILGVVGLGVSLVGYFADAKQFFHSYLTAYIFWATIGLGGLFFTLLHNLTGAKWSVVVRRLAETIMIALPFMAILFVPVIFGLGDLYHWSHHDTVLKDAILKKKAGYLNTNFFLIRSAGYFLIWFLIARILYKSSLAQDQQHQQRLTDKMRRVSAPGMVLFAITLTFASFDWLMSLDAHWYSTIFGVYIFGGSFLASLAFMILILRYLRQENTLADTVSVEHFHDLGKLLFAFVVFWAYMAYSQYFLIWYGNIPEETIWFQQRWVGTWKIFSLLLVFGQFTVPFFLLMPRASKRNLTFLAFMSWFLLVMHWVDMYWIVQPGHHAENAVLSWMDFTTMLGVGGLFVWFVWNRYTAHALVPINDPNLEASIRFVNS